MVIADMGQSVFRFDINGLRAIAVFFVVIFHYDRNILSGGFIGVDIFFVISGYLMTGVISRRLESNSLSVYNFYLSRLNRILPGLLFLIITVLIFGFLFIEPMSYRLVGKHAVSSLLFVSNIVYRNESNYFDMDSYNKYLLHTWSLSVEWQFYLIYPIFLFLISKVTSIESVKKIVTGFTIILFIYGYYSSKQDNLSSYFFLQSRSWEMLLGGIAYFYPFKFKKSVKFIIYYTSLLLLFLSAIYIKQKDLWPGYLSLFPTISTYLIISCSVKKNLLYNKILQYIGLRSYSVYLVHWPLLVFFKNIEININLLIYLFFTLIISCFLYFLVERKRNYSYKFILLYLLTIILSVYISKNGFSNRVNADYQLSRQAYRNRFEGHLGLPQSMEVQYFNGNELDFDLILIGDSHARHFFSYIKKHGIKVASLALDGCTSTKNFYSSYMKEMCSSRYEMEINFIKKYPKKSIIISRSFPGLGYLSIERDTNSYIGNADFNKLMINEFNIFFNEVNEGQNFYIIGDVPGSNKVMFECLAKADLPINKIFEFFKCDKTQKRKINLANNELKNISYDNVKFIDTYQFLCNSSYCSVIENGIPLYSDTSHLSKAGADIVGEGIFKIIKK